MTRDSGDRSVKTMLLLVALAALGVMAFFYLNDRGEQQQPEFQLLPVEPEQTGVLPPRAEPRVNNETPPVYEPPAPVVQAEPLPGLNESDSSVLASLQNLSAQTLAFVVPQEIIRKFVRAVNAVEEGKVVHEYRPITSPAPGFVAERVSTVGVQQPRFLINVENYHRYDALVTIVALLDTDALAAFYQRFYPLLEEAHAEMGLKKGNFHTVLVRAIDHLLAAPVIEQPLELVQPKVFYQYADEEVEALPSTHKLLLRMGPENTRSLQNSLKALKERITE
jgi:hypothetical protein